MEKPLDESFMEIKTHVLTNEQHLDDTRKERARKNIEAIGSIKLNEHDTVKGDVADLSGVVVPTPSTEDHQKVLTAGNDGSFGWNALPEGIAPYDGNPVMDGTASAGSSELFARGDHVHPADTSKANKSEMAITAVQGDASKNNIQLKTGLSQDVVVEHQDISGKADKATTYTKTEVDTALSGKAATDHNHDDRYYTESEVDTAFANKADKATTLAGYGITDAKIDNGTITLGSQTITPVVASDIEGKANKSEMSITEGTGTATIQLKNGTSATVLTQHQTIPEQKQADWNASSGVEKILNKPGIDSTLREYTDSQDNKLWGVQNPLPASIGGNSGDVLTIDNGAPVWMPPAPQGQVMVIFLDYNTGDDSNDGLTPVTQVQTLTKAISILMQHKNSVIYIRNGGSYNLNGAEAAHILSMDSEDQYTILKADLNIYCDTYLNLTFSDDTATSAISVVKLQGDVKIHAKGVLRLSRVDISGDHLDLTSETSIYIEDNGSGSMPLPVFKSKYINVDSNGIISMQYVNIQSDKTTAEVKFHTVKGNIDLRYSSITACHLSLTR